MEFKAYSKITNAHSGKFINKIASEFENEICEGGCEWSVTHKLDGGNFQIVITEDEVKYGRRKAFLGEDEKFFDWKSVMSNPDICTLIKYIKESNRGTDKHVEVFGELYGRGVQKRINYGEGKYFSVFDIRVNGQWIPQTEVKELLETAGVSNLYVEEFGVFATLDEALKFDTKISSPITNGDEIEGVVIKPYSKVLYLRNETRVIIKNKNESFADKAHKSRKVKTIVEATELEKEFSTYITKNRLLDLISKEGEYESKDIGRFMKMLFEDAWEDFFEANGEEIGDITRQEKGKYSKRVNKLMVELIKSEAN